VNLEEHFISCLLRSKNMRLVAEARITPEYFQDDQHRRVFEYVIRHHQQYGQMPLAVHIRRNWPEYRVLKVEHDLDYYVDEMKKQYLFEQMQLTLADMQEELEGRDPQAALRILQETVGTLSMIDSAMVDVDLSATYEQRLEDYEEFRENKGKLRGITTGFPSLDKATLGLQPKQFVVLVGLPKAGKSTMLLAMAIAAHTLGLKVLFIGFEMSNQEQGARYDSMVAKVDHLRLLSGEIGTKDIRDLERAGEARAGLDEFISSTDISAGATISAVAAKIDQYKPDVVFIDGLYLMDDENGEPKGSSQALTNISRGCKRMAQLKEVPIVGTTQVLHSKVSRSMGIQASSVGYTSAFGQDCDLMVAVEAVEDEPDIQRGKALLNRIGPRVEFEIEWDWSTGTFEETDAEDDDADAA
jgi:replicative DNA helicase